MNRSASNSLWIVLVMAIPILAGCSSAPQSPPAKQEVPHRERWGIYRLELASQEISLLYSAPGEITGLRQNANGDRFVFSQKVGGREYEHSEIFTLGADGNGGKRLTDNDLWDLYPAWSPDGTKIAFLSWRDKDLDLYLMDADGGNQRLLYNSGDHDADPDWSGDQIVFTSGSRVWIMDASPKAWSLANRRQRAPLSDPPRAGEWGQANLPFGDYDPRLRPGGGQVLFSRLVGDDSPHGNYDLFIVNITGGELHQLTHSGHSQGLSSWSHSGERILYIIAAVDGAGAYDLYMMDADGSNNHNITPEYAPADFLIHWAVFSDDDSAVYFVGEWWSEE